VVRPYISCEGTNSAAVLLGAFRKRRSVFQKHLLEKQAQLTFQFSIPLRDKTFRATVSPFLSPQSSRSLRTSALYIALCPPIRSCPAILKLESTTYNNFAGQGNIVVRTLFSPIPCIVVVLLNLHQGESLLRRFATVPIPASQPPILDIRQAASKGLICPTSPPWTLESRRYTHIPPPSK
jgi:hypothetical protein